MEVLCESCGVGNPPGVEFCMFCGAYLEWTERESATETRRDLSRMKRPAGAATPPVESGSHTSPDRATLEAADEVPVLVASQRQPAPVRAAAPAPAGPAFTGAARAVPSTCAQCGRTNEPDLHFCAKCGQTLRDEPSGPAPSSTTAWRRMLEDRDRSARRAYRRSLPPLYRWRRVLIGVLVPVLVVGALVAVGQHPIRWVQERWWDLRGTTVAISGVSAATNPANASAPDADPASLLDGTEQAWTEPWNPAAEGQSCGGAPGTGTVVLTLPPTRIREIDLHAGLPVSNPNRTLQVRPQAIGVRFDSGPCRRFTLEDTPDLQRLEVDSQVAVTMVTIGVDTTHPAPDDGTALLSITEVELRSRPAS